MVFSNMFLLLTLIAGARSECTEPAGGTDYVLVFVASEDNSESLALNVVNPDGSATTASISSPLDSDSISLGAGVTTGSSTLQSAHAISGTQRSSNVIQVTSSENVVVLGSRGGSGSCDGFLALPRSSLGTSYIPVTYWPPYTGAVVGVVAPEDSTTVTMTFPEDKGITFILYGTTYEGGDTLTVTLKAMEALQIQDLNDLSGVLINSDKPIAVFSGNRGSIFNVDAFEPRGHLEAQIPPTDTWGTEFYIPPFPDRANTLIKFVAATANTMATVYSETETKQWTSKVDGDFQDTIVFPGSQYATIIANGPILVVSFAESGTTDSSQYSEVPAMLLVPAVSQYRKDYYISWSTTNAPDILLVVQSEEVAGVQVDGVSDASGWTPFPNSNYVGKVVKPSGSGPSTITHASVEFGAMVYGNELDTCSFAYPAGLCLQSEVPTSKPPVSTESDNATEAVATTNGATTGKSETTVTNDDTVGTDATSGKADATTASSMTDPTAASSMTDPTAASSMTEVTKAAPAANESCGCPALFVTGPSSQKSIVGIYQLHDCLIADRQAYMHSSGSNYIYYNESSSKWVFASDLEPSTSAIVESSSGSEQFPFDVAGIWDVRDDDIGWKPAETVKAECVCTKPVCDVVTITSDDAANTFPGSFTYHSDVNDRPAYYNSEQGVYLYFHSGGDCHFWAVADSLNANLWLMYSYDISPRPNEVKIAWQVSKTSGWTEDDSLAVVCS